MSFKRTLIISVLATGLLLTTWLYATATGGDGAGSHVASVQAAPRAGDYVIFFPIIGKNILTVPIAPLWRFGVAKARRPFTDYDLNSVVGLRAGWYVDWGASGSSLFGYGIEYVPMIRVKQVKSNGGTPTSAPCRSCPYYQVSAGVYTYTVSLTPSQIQTQATGRPGMTWVIGNEIERLDWGDGAGAGQDEITPQLYAQAYHEIYTTIKNADPTAQVAIGGVIEATPLRLQYLELVWNTYLALYGSAMPVDVWNIHAFVLQEVYGSWGAETPAGLPTGTSGMLYSVYDNKNFTLAAGQIVNMRTWMKTHGQQAKPLIITEYGVNMPPWWTDWVSYPFTYEQVRDSFMYPSFNYFLNTADCNLSAIDGCRLVQRWNWWSFDDDSLDSQGRQAYNGNLFSSGLNSPFMNLTDLGTYWTQYVQGLPPGATKPY